MITVLPVDRHKFIYELVKERGSVSIREISESLGVSMVTARKDVDTLADKGLLVRTWGGVAVSTVGASFEPLYYEKRNLNREAKMRIGAAAAAIVNEGDTIVLDSGSTTFEMISHLRELTNLTVITYDLMIAVELSTNSAITVIVAGGIVRNNLYSLRGAPTVDMLRALHADKAFLTADAVDAEWGVTNATIEGATIKQSIVQSSDEVVLVADRSKFGRRALSRVVGLDSLSQIITDSELPADIQSAVVDLGLQVLTVGANG